MNPELKFSREVREGLRQLKFKVHPVESHSVSVGMPDLHFIKGGISGWLELKWTDTMPTRITLRPAQQVWLTEYWGEGGSCWVLQGWQNGMVLWPGFRARELARGSLVGGRELGNRKWAALAQPLLLSWPSHS